MERSSRAGEEVNRTGKMAMNMMESHENIKMHGVFCKFNNEVVICSWENKKLSEKGGGGEGMLLMSYLALQRKILV